MGKVPRGLPKSYIKKWGISKLAWRKFRAGALTKGIRTRTKAIKRRIRRTRRSRNPARKRGVRRMVRRRKRRRGGKSMTRTAFKLIRLGALVGGGIQSYQAGAARGGVITGIQDALLGYGGIGEDGKFHAHVLARHWTPFIVACAATYGIPKLVSIIRRL